MSTQLWNRLCFSTFLVTLLWIMVSGASLIQLFIYGWVIPFVRLVGNDYISPPKSIDDLVGIHYGPLVVLYVSYGLISLYLCWITGVPLTAYSGNTSIVLSLALTAIFHLSVGVASFITHRQEVREGSYRAP